MSIVAVPKTSRKPQPCQYSNVPAPAKRTIATATRSCASPRKALAERVGFEPTRLSPTAFRERHHQPLGHLSASKFTERTRVATVNSARAPPFPLRVGRHCRHVRRAPRRGLRPRGAGHLHHAARRRVRLGPRVDLLRGRDQSHHFRARRPDRWHARRPGRSAPGAPRRPRRDRPRSLPPALAARPLAAVPALRSEERRVGKECRSRWWPYE